MAVPEYNGPLQLGDEGPNTKRLQERLQERGYRLEEADGIFGPITERAVKKFQEFAGLEADGVVGRLTHNALWTLEITD